MTDYSPRPNRARREPLTGDELLRLERLVNRLAEVQQEFADWFAVVADLAFVRDNFGVDSPEMEAAGRRYDVGCRTMLPSEHRKWDGYDAARSIQDMLGLRVPLTERGTRDEWEYAIRIGRCALYAAGNVEVYG